MTELPTRIDRVAIDCFDEPAGTLTQPAHYEFLYEPGATHPCSLWPPLRQHRCPLNRYTAEGTEYDAEGHEVGLPCAGAYPPSASRPSGCS